jgi:DNA-binding HxlR family transcriptional regulator
MRSVYPTVPPRVEYGLTELGIEAGRLTSAIAEWSVEHASDVLAARQDFDDRATQDPEPVSMTAGRPRPSSGDQ